MALSTAVANAIYDLRYRQTNATAPTVLYLSLHTAAPGATGANEVSDANYARVLVTTAFGAPTAGAGSNTVAIEQAAGAATGFTVTHFGLWSAVTAGTYYEGHALTASKAVGVGEILRFAIGELDLTVV